MNSLKFEEISKSEMRNVVGGQKNPPEPSEANPGGDVGGGGSFIRIARDAWAGASGASTDVATGGSATPSVIGETVSIVGGAAEWFLDNAYQAWGALTGAITIGGGFADDQDYCEAGFTEFCNPEGS
ncbi:MAG: hypothetical protein KI790_16495 [Cyclobacteriaceae bacterium]|nr:hypothetical protein [Cyclobacteriaceae bacterium HetDA_MAG_MS6]